MKKLVLRITTVCMVVVLVSQLMSCEKVADIIKNPDGNAQIKHCNIKKITTQYAGKEYVYDFIYNVHGNPVRINSNAASMALNSLVFAYDNNKRLKYYFEEPVAPQQGNEFLFLHRFSYDAQKRIIADSVFAAGTFAGLANGSYDPLSVNYFEYDQFNRISKVTEVSYPGSPVESINYSTYAYNNQGNLVKDPAVVYDNKTSLRRTNSIWMFLARDYSLNNAFTAPQYNQHGLPLSGIFEDSPYNWDPMFFPILMRDSQIEYACN